MFKIIILTLERNISRYKIYQNDDNYKDSILFIGVDGALLDKNMKNKISNNYLPNNVVSCAYGHYLIWKYIVSNNIDYALILEDDTFLNFDNLKIIYNDIINKFNKSNTGIVYLYNDYVMYDKNSIHYNNNNYLNPVLAHFVSLVSAEKLINIFNTEKFEYHLDTDLVFKSKKYNIINYAINYIIFFLLGK